MESIAENQGLGVQVTQTSDWENKALLLREKLFELYIFAGGRESARSIWSRMRHLIELAWTRCRI